MSIEHLNILNQGLIKDCLLALMAFMVTVYYYKTKKATFIVAFFVTAQFIFDMFLLPIKFHYSFGYDWQYLISSTTASYVVIRLLVEIHYYDLKITAVETGVVILETFIVICQSFRFFDKLLFSHATSEIYTLICYLAYYFIIAALLIPVLREIAVSSKSYIQSLKIYNIRKQEEIA